MDPTKKEVAAAKKRAKKVEKTVKKDRLKELEDLVVLMDKKITKLENKMDSMDDIFKRIRTRIGV